VGFDYPGEDFHALTQLRMRGLKHGVGLADTGGGAEENLEAATAVSGQVC
jgi:hypothetical protein